MSGENGTTSNRARFYASIGESSDADGNAVATVRELRRTSAGKTALARSGRDRSESQRRPGASEDRRFVGWDGEGITYVEGTAQSYVLFGNSEGFSVQAAEGEALTTEQCLSLMVQAELDDPTVYHVGFGFTYDVNMILKDIPRFRLQRLRKEGVIRWKEYRIEWRPSKWFQVTGVLPDKTKVTCRIWDLWGFFQSSFVKALRSYLGERPEFDDIESGKGKRGGFTYEELETLVKPYWQSELRYMALLAERLRSYLYSVGLHVTQWHGPGAIASYKLRQLHMDKHMASCPIEVNEAAQYAYGGGRFELFKLGRYLGPVYQYDINSAYPEAISLLPSLARGNWRHVDTFDPHYRFAVYRIRMVGPLMDASIPYPLFLRDKRHCMHYPPIVEGWYWAPEVANIAHWEHVEVVEGWVFADDGTMPYEWVRDVYADRLIWKNPTNYNPCEKALKLLLNSLYGKMAQRVGYDKKKMRPPKWHQLEWAGWVTSYARAKLYRAMLAAGESLIAVETDAVFSSKELPMSVVEVGTGLGQWDLKIYDEIIYLQSGFRFVRQGDKWSHKFRGFDPDSIKREHVETYLQEVDLNEIHKETAFQGSTTRFIGMGAAFISNDPTIWRTWTTTTRALKMGTDGKRIHIKPFCHACRTDQSPYDEFHDLAVSMPQGGTSTKHRLPWKDGLSVDQQHYDHLKELAGEQR